jgi:large subunit ribosomal protein L13
MLKPTHYTKTESAANIVRAAHLIDVKNEKLGRIASKIAVKLIGKDKVNYAPNLDMGDYVVIINAALLKISQRKIETKEYKRYSGYQSGLKIIPLAKLWPSKAEEVIRLAIKGMLPDNKLKKNRLKRLFIFNNENYSVPPKVKKLIVLPVKNG